MNLRTVSHESRRGGKVSARPRTRRSCFSLELLEDRIAPAVFNVTGLGDGLFPLTQTGPNTFNAPTLRSAIQASNTISGNNTINLTKAGTYEITIPGANTGTNKSGAFAILSHGGNLNIVNTSGHAVTVDGNHLDRVFDINPNPHNTPRFTVTLQGFTIRNGVAQPGDGAAGSGGGIRDQGNVSLTLNNMIVTGNIATADGGGISMENLVSTPWTLTINNSNISNNHAGDAGGGVETDGSGNVIITPGTVINGNTSLNQGAGVWLDAIQVGTVFQGANLTITGAKITNNLALATNNFGGGIGNAGNGAVTITNSTVSNNFSGGDGGGFADENNQGRLTVTSSTFDNNTAVADGGGIEEGGPLSITTTSIDQNNAGGNGGGIFAKVLVLQASSVENNESGGNGGGIDDVLSSNQNSTIANATITGNIALNNAGANGGGIEADTSSNGTLSLTNVTITNNFALNGGGVFWNKAGNNSKVRVHNTLIAGNILNNINMPLIPF